MGLFQGRGKVYPLLTRTIVLPTGPDGLHGQNSSTSELKLLSQPHQLWTYPSPMHAEVGQAPGVNAWQQQQPQPWVNMGKLQQQQQQQQQFQVGGPSGGPLQWSPPGGGAPPSGGMLLAAGHARQGQMQQYGSGGDGGRSETRLGLFTKCFRRG